jgi:hypothetical protein
MRHSSIVTTALQNTIAKRAFARRYTRCYLLSCGDFSHATNDTGGDGMEKLLNSLTGTIIAGFVLVVVEILVIHAIH